ncbi:MAG: NAD(P)-dependent alcohol dehydrogenase [Candidatus Omnitrophota bacterium]
MSILAYAASGPKETLKVFRFDAPQLGPWDVEVKVTHCGICHSDVHLIDNDWNMNSYPLVPGHEVVGIVKAAGKNVQKLKAGDRVGIGWQSGSCQTCEWCIKGEENLCADNKATCVGHYGGFAETLYTDSRFAFLIPEKLKSENAAPLLCGGATVYSPLARHVRSSMKVGVIGIGGLGHLGLQFARAFGCEVTAFSSDPTKEKEAKDFGAHHFVASNKVDQLKKLSRSLDFILSTVNVDLDWGKFLQVLRPNGKLCMVGVPGNPMEISAFALISGQKSVVGSVIGSRSGIEEMLEFSAHHNIAAKTETMPLSDVNKAVEKVRQNKARYRMVLTV